MLIPQIWLSAKEYSWSQFRADLGAGLVVGLVALPLAMAFAIASGLGPERGLYTAVVAGFLISALGGSRVQIGGPTGAFVVIVAGIVSTYGYNGLVLATLMAGVMLVVMGLSQLGSMVKFIPYPVITGFTSGIAVIIFSSQIKDFLGLQMEAVPADFLEKWAAYARTLSTVNYWALGAALFTTLCIGLWPKRWQRVPGSIVALVTVSAVVAALDLPLETIQSRFGGVPHGLPAPSWPQWSWMEVKALLPSAFTVALLASIESLLSAVVADGMIGGRHNSNMELIAQGVANLVSPIFGGMPATGAIARTATNVKNGGRTPVAGMIHAVVLLVILLAAGNLAAHIPLACLAGVLVIVSYHMSEWRSFKSIFLGPRSDVVVLLITFFLTVLIDLTVAVEVGMVMAAFLFMKNMADLTQVRTLTREPASEDFGEPSRTAGPSTADRSTVGWPEDVQVFSIQGSFFFGAANKLLEVLRIMSKPPRVLVLEMRGVLHMDATGLRVMDQVYHDCRHRGIRLMIVGIHTQPFLVMEKANKFKEFGEENFKESMEECLEALNAG